MPYIVHAIQNLAGYRVNPQGSFLSGKNFRNEEATSTPNMVKRAKPKDISLFSLSNTPRIYRTRTVSFSDMGSRCNGYETEYRPVGWNGGIGFWGFNIPGPWNLQTRLALRLKNQTANLAITLVQYRELSTLFSSFAGSVLYMFANIQRLRNPRNMLRLFKTGRLSPQVTTLLKSGSALYLGYLFGVKQFASDFKAISEALRRRFDDPMYQTLDPMSFREMRTTTRKGGSGLEKWECETTDLLKTRVKAQFRVFPNDQVLAQMGMTNLPALAYDAIPFSFVLNWLIPVGQYLSALDALQGIGDLRWYYTSKATQQSFCTYPEWGASKATYLWEETARSSMQQNLKPPLPRFEPSKYASNVATAVALLGALRKSPHIDRTIIRI